MKTFNDLQQIDHYYLLKISSEHALDLYNVILKTDKASLLVCLGNSYLEPIWVKNSDPIEDFVEELSPENADLALSAINLLRSQLDDEYYGDEEMDEDDEDDFEDFEFEEDDEDEDDFDDEDDDPEPGNLKKLN